MMTDGNCELEKKKQFLLNENQGGFCVFLYNYFCMFPSNFGSSKIRKNDQGHLCAPSRIGNDRP